MKGSRHKKFMSTLCFKMDRMEFSSVSDICSDRVLVDYRTDKTAINELEKLGVAVYKTTPIESLYKEVCGHSDMQMHFVNEKAICAPETYNYYKTLNLSNIELICGTKNLTDKYPDDIAYNVCSIGDFVICRPLCTAIEILSEYRSLNKNILNSKQGYAKCSICVVNDYSAITADNGMYKLLKTAGINVLKIQEGFIELYNMNGFIGGATGLINNNTLCFNGDLETHPDSNEIKAFCKNVNIDTVSLNRGYLKDIGSILKF